MSRVLIIAIALQMAPRPLSPAATLLAPELLQAIERASVEGKAPTVIAGTDASAGEIVLACAKDCEPVEWAINKLAASGIPRPSRSIRMVKADQAAPRTAKAAIFVAAADGLLMRVVRGPWSTAGVADEVVEVFARHATDELTVGAYENVGQPKWDAAGIPTTAIVPPRNAGGLDRSSFIAAATAYFLATLPNPGAEALLSHLTVGAHARLAEDGRRAIAQMGAQQRAGGDVLVLLGQAIEREQRRMRNVERFMPEPIDPMLRSRLADMEKGITSVWTSMGITSSAFVPAAERLRGRSGEDRRVPARATTAATTAVDLPAVLARHPNAAAVADELNNFIDGKRSVSDIRDAVAAEFGSVPLPAVVEYFESLEKARVISLR